MIRSKGWDWDNVHPSDYSFHISPTEYGYFLAHKWREAGRQTVLDIGTGLGRHAVCFAKNGLKVSAMDISESGLRHLRSWAENENLTIDVKAGDMLFLPYADSSFDCVFAYHVLSHSDTAGVKQAIREIERVLKPNGEVFLSFSSKETTDFVEEKYPKTDGNTMLWPEGPEKGEHPLYYVNLPDIMALLANFRLESIKHTEIAA